MRDAKRQRRLTRPGAAADHVSTRPIRVVVLHPFPHIADQVVDARDWLEVADLRCVWPTVVVPGHYAPLRELAPSGLIGKVARKPRRRLDNSRLPWTTARRGARLLA